jgi:hypothetical protein
LLAPALTILLSSFLLFLVQPILAKQILPWFGGSAAVWTVCLVFFQVVLVLGYTYAHLLTRRLVGSRQFILHISLLLLSCAMLPIIPGSSWMPDQSNEPALRILTLLAMTVGLPYLLLSSTGPLLQRWLSSVDPGATANRSIYRLFALSNLGSLFGLVSYPFAIEPFAPVRAQAWAWSLAYALFVVCSITYAWRRRRLAERENPPTAEPIDAGSSPSRRRYAYWIGCAALGSALLLSVTNQITQNVAAIPLLWIVPLSLYLLSFVICFEGRAGRGWYERKFWVTPAMLAAGVMAWALFADGGNLSARIAVPVFAAGMFLGCLVCHGELARTKPSPEYLTHFYLSLAAGGALGGLLVGLVAPMVFKGYWEMPLVIAALCLLGVHCCSADARQGSSAPWSANVVVALLATALILLLLGELPAALDSYATPWAKIVQGDARWGCGVLLILSAVLLQRYRLWRAVGLAALTCTLTFDWIYYHKLSTGTAFWDRNFYGALRVIELPYAGGRIRKLMHGTILHGSQVMQLPQREIPTTYYGESSGIGRTLTCEHRMNGRLRIGSIGLGAGTLAAYGARGDLFRVYEINPAVVDIARNQFDYLADSKAQVEPVLGDARLSLEREVAGGAFDRAEQRYDVLSLDAFSGDAIPVHLLTREAFAVYMRVTKPDGVIAFHLTNRFLDLPPVVLQITRDAGFQAVLVEDYPTWDRSTSTLNTPSYWVLVTRNTTFLQDPEIAAHSRLIVPRVGLREWSDQFTSLLQILK